MATSRDDQVGKNLQFGPEIFGLVNLFKSFEINAVSVGVGSGNRFKKIE